MAREGSIFASLSAGSGIDSIMRGCTTGVYMTIRLISKRNKEDKRIREEGAGVFTSLLQTVTGLDSKPNRKTCSVIIVPLNGKWHSLAIIVSQVVFARARNVGRIPVCSIFTSSM